MVNSIHEFQEKGFKNLEKIFQHYADHPRDMAGMVNAVWKELSDFGCALIAEEWEYYDKLLRKHKHVRKGWQVERSGRERSVLCSLGEIRFKRTLFYNPRTEEYKYLLDDFIGLEKHARLTEDALARMLSEASESSYQKGGENASMTNSGVSKSTVMEHLHTLVFPPVPPLPETEKRKEVPFLYIDADEDHVALQFLERKGDIPKGRDNTVMPKPVYVYEGTDLSGDRPKLVGKRFFGGDMPAEELWNRVYAYIGEYYDEETLQRIYINGDGAQWIRNGAKRHAKAGFVLDRYHMGKYIIAATSHLKDSAEDARSELYRAINGKRKWQAEETFKKILEVTESESRRKSVETSRDYILGNWAGIMEAVKSRKRNRGCSAEGHVSHVYSARLSSRPLSWSRRGADQMARLRIYRANGGDMLALVRYQREELPKAAGAEEVILSAGKMIAEENRNRERLGCYADMPMYSIPYPQIKKIAAIRDHIYGL